jgi:hypothetical protein
VNFLPAKAGEAPWRLKASRNEIRDESRIAQAMGMVPAPSLIITEILPPNC